MALLVVAGATLRDASTALASHVTRETVDVAVRAGGQYDPSIKGDSISYTDTSVSANGADIVVYSISAGQDIRTISGSANGAQEIADIDGDYVVFRQWTSSDTEGEIHVYRISTNSYTTITNDNHEQLDPAISGTTLVWTQVENFGTESETSTIWAGNVDGSNVRALSPGGGYQIDPAISGNTVVWYENGSIIAFDLVSLVRTTIATGADRWPDVSGTKIAYALAGNIYVSEAGNTTTITNDAAIQRRPKVSAELVAWEESGDILGWDFRTNEFVTLAGGDGVQELHDLDGTNLAFTDRSTDAAGDIKLSREVVAASVPDSITLSPPSATNPVGTSHTVTATVKDASEVPVPNVIVRFSVTGSVTTSGSCTTDPNGECGFTYTGPSLPGADAISAYADTDGDDVQDVGEPVALVPATKAWVLPTSTAGHASGGGHITDATSGKVAFGFSAKSEAGTFHGQCNVIDPGNRMIKCLDVTTLVISANQATIYGNATDNGVATSYVMKVADNADPGKGADTFSITTASGYSASGTLTVGNIQVE